MKVYHIAIVGATGLVGRTFLDVLAKEAIEIGRLKLFASEESLGKTLMFRGQSYQIETIQKGAFSDIDYALFSAGSLVAKQYARQVIEEGAIMIDNSSAFRMQKDVPLVVPEVNMQKAYGQPLIANPNCSTIQSVIPLFALNQAFGLEQVIYSTYQAVSGSGQKGLLALESKRSDVYPYDISETCIPEIDVFLEDGYTKEEEKMMLETKKILDEPNLAVTATCVRVPVKVGHAVSIFIKLKSNASLEAVRSVLQKQPGLVLLDDPTAHLYPTSTMAKGKDTVFVGRIRQDRDDPKQFWLYVAADNVRKGAASNAIQIMKGLMKRDQGQ